jgi:hypothetical protein
MCRTFSYFFNGLVTVGNQMTARRKRQSAYVCYWVMLHLRNLFTDQSYGHDMVHPISWPVRDSARKSSENAILIPSSSALVFWTTHFLSTRWCYGIIPDRIAILKHVACSARPTRAVPPVKRLWSVHDFWTEWTGHSSILYGYDADDNCFGEWTLRHLQ